MRDSGYMLKYLILSVIQVLLWNYFNFSQYLLPVFLPVMIAMLPTRHSTIFAMLLAFCTAFAVDFFVSGMLGLCCMSLLPVAFTRKFLVRLIFGSELLSRGDNVSLSRLGLGKMTALTAISNGIFLFIYLWADGAGTRSPLFNLLKFSLSLLVSTIVSLYISFLMDPDRN